VTSLSDLQVEIESDALSGRRLDVVVSGSIACVESVRFVRSLRRLGADVRVVLTRGAQKFVGIDALAWASGQKVLSDFDGLESHLAERDACIIAPASASLLGKIEHGITDTPSSALIASYLGLKRLVMAVPGMHGSLMDSPFIAENIARLKSRIHFFAPRQEENKHKFPDPAHLADLVSNKLNSKHHDIPVLVTMGSTRGYIDDVRYVSNYSSGALGSALAEELFRYGFNVVVVCGSSQIRPHASSELHSVLTTDEMERAIKSSLSKHKFKAAVFTASVLDFEPTERQTGKISSKKSELQISMKPTKKLISLVTTELQAKIACKLLTKASAKDETSIVNDYFSKYALTGVLSNFLEDVSATSHEARFFEGDRSSSKSSTTISGKRATAKVLCRHIISRLEIQEINA
jgi:phosphopantothenoylcysteine decarboxylase/phosphopantothenate--cysteine ligase